MIVKPTVNELLEHIENRFALVIVASKRARQIAGGEEKLTSVNEESPVTIATNEINEGKILILDKEEQAEVIENEENDNEE